MANDFQAFRFTFSGSTQIDRRPKRGPRAEEEPSQDAQVADRLNDEAVGIAQNIQDEIENVLRSYSVSATVQAEVRFRASSPLLVEGTVIAIVVGWLAPFAPVAGKAAAQAVLSTTVKIVTQKVVERALRQRGLPPGGPLPGVAAFNINVTEQQKLDSEPIGQPSQRALFSGSVFERAVLVINTVLLLLILIILLFLIPVGSG